MYNVKKTLILQNSAIEITTLKSTVRKEFKKYVLKNML